MTIKTYKQNLIDTYERLIRNKTNALERIRKQLAQLQATLDEIKAETAYDDGTGGPLPPIVRKAPRKP